MLAASHAYKLVVLVIESQPVIQGQDLLWRQTGHIICEPGLCEVPRYEGQ